MWHILCRTIFWFKKSLSLIKSHLNICSLFPCSPKCSPNLHHRRLIFQRGDLCFSLHVSLFGWNIKFSTCTFSGIFRVYIFCKSVSLIAYCKSLLISELRRFPILKKKTKKKKESYFLFHHEYWLEPNFFVGHSLYSRDFLSRSIKSIIWKERKP